jgi:hypothetical protein
MRECVTGSWWSNADYRIFDFDERNVRAQEVEGEKAPLRLKQWELTAKAHWDDQEQRELSGGLGVSWAETINVGDFADHYTEL